VLEFFCREDHVLEVRVSGVVTGLLEDAAQLSEALLNVYLGENAVIPSLKTQCIENLKASTHTGTVKK